MAIEAKDILGYLGYENPDKITSMDDFKKVFDPKFGIKADLLLDKKFVGEIYGKKIGSIETKFKSLITKSAGEFSAEEIKDLKVEEIMELGITKLNAANKKAMDDLTASSKGSSDEQVTALQGKNDALQIKFDENKVLLDKAVKDFSEFKNDTTTKTKETTLKSFRDTAMGKLKFKPDITAVEKMGFEGVVDSKYILELDDSQALVVKSKETGEKIPSDKVTGQFKNIDEVLGEELIENKLVSLNPDGGKAAPASTSPTAKPAAGAEEKKGLAVHPNAAKAVSDTKEFIGAQA